MDFLNLPVELLAEICSNWLCITSIARLDAACCNHAARANFFAVAFSTDCCLRYEREDLFQDAENVWIVQRRARVRGLHITESLRLPSASDYFVTYGKLMEFVQFSWFEGLPKSGDLLTKNIVDYCHNIRRLETDPSVSIDSLVRIFQACRLLEDIDIMGEQLSALSLAELNSCPHLRILTISCVLSEEIVIHVTCPTLESITIANEGVVSLDDVFGLSLAQSCRLLQVIRVESSSVTDATIDAIATNCRELHTFCLHSENITGEALERLTEACSLRELSFHIPTDIDIDVVAKNSTGLTKLCMFNSYEYHWNECMSAVANHCPDLRELRLRDWYLVGSANGLRALGERCHNLECLHFEYARDSPESDWYAAISGCRNLREFRLSGPVTDDVLCALSHCPLLTKVDLWDDSVRLSEASVISLARGCAVLESLSLPKRTEITMKVLRALSWCCPWLTYLECKPTDELLEHCLDIFSLLPRCVVNWIEEQEDEEEEDGGVQEVVEVETEEPDATDEGTDETEGKEVE